MRKTLFLTSLVGLLIGCIICYKDYRQNQDLAPLEIAAPYESEAAFTSHYEISEVEVTYFDEKAEKDVTRTAFVRNADIDDLKEFKSIRFFEEKELTIEQALELAHSNESETFDEHFCEVSAIKMDNIKNLYLYEYFDNGHQKIPTMQLKQEKHA